MTAARRRWLRLGLTVTLVADLVCLCVAVWWIVARSIGSDGVGSVSAGISEPALLLGAPLMLHGVAQVLARQRGARGRRLWLWHLAAVAAMIAIEAIAEMRPPAGSVRVLVPIMELTCWVSQHVLLAITVWRGVRTRSV